MICYYYHYCHLFTALFLLGRLFLHPCPPSISNLTFSRARAGRLKLAFGWAFRKSGQAGWECESESVQQGGGRGTTSSIVYQVADCYLHHHTLLMPSLHTPHPSDLPYHHPSSQSVRADQGSTLLTPPSSPSFPLDQALSCPGWWRNRNGPAAVGCKVSYRHRLASSLQVDISGIHRYIKSLFLHIVCERN